MLLLLLMMINHKNTVLFYILTVNPACTLAEVYDVVHLEDKHIKLFLGSKSILEKHYNKC